MTETFELNKIANLVTVDASLPLEELKRRLNRDGFYFGYHPLEATDASLGDYAARRVTNLYHFKYGSIAELTAGMTVKLKSGGCFRLKTAPRSAIGPDFNRFILGSRGRLGDILDLTLKLMSVPECVRCAIIKVPSRESARSIVAFLYGRFAKPLFFKYFDLDTAAKLPHLKGNNKGDPATEALVVGLSGLESIVTAEEEMTEEASSEAKAIPTWLNIPESQELMNRHIFTETSYAEIAGQYRDFIHPTTDTMSQTLLEKEFLESLSVKE